jgi:hypothetical protein
MIGPPATVGQGKAGTLHIGGMRAGILTEWRVVVSPTTKLFTLFGTGRIGRYYAQAVGGVVRAELTPAPVPKRIGRKTPPTPKPFVLRGIIAELTGRTITISHGEVEQNKVLDSSFARE